MNHATFTTLIKVMEYRLQQARTQIEELGRRISSYQLSLAATQDDIDDLCRFEVRPNMPPAYRAQMEMLRWQELAAKRRSADNVQQQIDSLQLEFQRLHDENLAAFQRLRGVRAYFERWQQRRQEVDLRRYWADQDDQWLLHHSGEAA